jgi:hypothetical protein
MATRRKHQRWIPVSRRRFVRQSAEVAAAGLFGMGALDGIIDSVVQRLDERTKLGALGHQVAEVLQQSAPAWASVYYYYPMYSLTADDPGIMSGALNNANHKTTITATIDPPEEGVTVNFEVVDETGGSVAARVDPTSAQTNANGQATTVLTSSNTGLGGSVTVRAWTRADKGDMRSVGVEMLLPQQTVYEDPEQP